MQMCMYNGQEDQCEANLDSKIRIKTYFTNSIDIVQFSTYCLYMSLFVGNSYGCIIHHEFKQVVQVFVYVSCFL